MITSIKIVVASALLAGLSGCGAEKAPEEQQSDLEQCLEGDCNASEVKSKQQVEKDENQSICMSENCDATGKDKAKIPKASGSSNASRKNKVSIKLGGVEGSKFTVKDSNQALDSKILYQFDVRVDSALDSNPRTLEIHGVGNLNPNEKIEVIVTNLADQSPQVKSGSLISIVKDLIRGDFILSSNMRIIVRNVDKYSVIGVDGLESAISLPLGMSYSAVPFTSVLLSDGSTVSSSGIDYSLESADASTVEVTAPIVLLAKALGQAEIQVKFEYLSFPIPATVTAAVPVSVSIDGINSLVNSVAIFDLTASEHYSDGSQIDITANGSFSSSDINVLEFHDANFPNRVKIKAEDASANIIFTRGSETHSKTVSINTGYVRQSQITQVGVTNTVITNTDPGVCLIGMRKLTVRLRNDSGADLQGSFFLVNSLTKNLLYNSDNSNNSVGAIVENDFTGNGIWENGEEVSADFIVCIRQSGSYQFYMDSFSAQ